MKEGIETIIKSSIDTKKKLIKTEIPNIEKAIEAIKNCLEKGGKLILFGNGGSAADSQHIAAEFVGRFKIERKGLPAVALTTNTSTITALANDYGYDITFQRQLESLGRKGDVAIAISTSGNAKNVLEAVKSAKKMGLTTVALTGGSGGGLKSLCDISITAGGADTARAQETHILIGHIIAEIVESNLG